MTLLLNTELHPLRDKNGAPIPSGWIVTSDEVDDASLFTEVDAKDIPSDAENLSEAAQGGKPKSAKPK